MTTLELGLRCNFKTWAKYLPGTPVDNLEILKAQGDFLGKKRLAPGILDVGIQRRFGHHQRYWVRKPWEPLKADLPTSEDLAFMACEQLRLANTPSCLVHGTTTSSRYTSSQATAIAGRLGWEIPAFELKAGCSTSLVSLMTAFTFLHAGYPDVVVTCAETLSKVLSPDEPDSWFGLSDAGAALHIEKDAKGPFEVKKVHYRTFGQYVNLFTTQATLPPTPEQVAAHGYTMTGDANTMKTVSYEHYESMMREFLPTQAERDAIDYIIPHQVNLQIVKNLKKDLKLGGDFFWIADRMGNPGGAAALLALVTALEEGFLKRSGRILLMSVGGGLSCACQIIDYKKD